MNDEQRAGPDTAQTAERICIVANPGAGHGHGNDLDALVAASDGAVVVRRLGRQDSIGEAARAAADEGFATVAAAGGDGTIAAVAGALSGTGCTLGVLPLGTFNYVARGLGLPLELERAFEVMRHGGTERLPIGEVNGRIFLNNASLGIYPQILQQRERTYRRWGRSRLVAYWSTAATILSFRHPRTLRVTVDGTAHRVRTPLAFIALSTYQLEAFGLEGAECIREGGFAVLLAPETGRLGLLRFAANLMSRNVQRHRDFELLCGREVSIESRRKRQIVAYDGERKRMRSPFRFSRHPDGLLVRVPAGEGRR